MANSTQSYARFLGTTKTHFRWRLGDTRRYSATFGDIISSHQQCVDTYIYIYIYIHVRATDYRTLTTRFVLDACRGESFAVSYNGYETKTNVKTTWKVFNITSVSYIFLATKKYNHYCVPMFPPSPSCE